VLRIKSPLANSLRSIGSLLVSFARGFVTVLARCLPSWLLFIQGAFLRPDDSSRPIITLGALCDKDTKASNVLRSLLAVCILGGCFGKLLSIAVHISLECTAWSLLWVIIGSASLLSYPQQAVFSCNLPWNCFCRLPEKQTEPYDVVVPPSSQLLWVFPLTCFLYKLSNSFSNIPSTFALLRMIKLVDGNFSSVFLPAGFLGLDLIRLRAFVCMKPWKAFWSGFSSDMTPCPSRVIQFVFFSFSVDPLLSEWFEFGVLVPHSLCSSKYYVYLIVWFGLSIIRQVIWIAWSGVLDDSIFFFCFFSYTPFRPHCFHTVVPGSNLLCVKFLG